MANTDIDINKRFKDWLERLLDLSKRNQLISCPLPKSSGRRSLLINHPSCEVLWSNIIEDQKSIEFPIPTKEEKSESKQLEIFSTEDQNVEKYRHLKNTSSNGISTNQTPDETYKTLGVLMKKARISMEEMGFNILYLAFGFLNWKEIGDISENKLRSPLVLVPVRLSQKNLLSPIVLSMLDDEITPNYSLERKLRNDFGLNLPKWGDDTDLAEYLNDIQQNVKSRGWSVSTDTQLSLYSFQKINMYRDLERNSEKIKEHHIVRALVGEWFDDGIDTSDIKSYDHDATEPREVFSVLDSDSSQQDAILLAKRGKSFVLEGPPGTGKSQTITNIIAELIASGKKVLFVSQKQAALEVVCKRLKNVGLENFCLTLHNHNAKKSEILDQFKRSLDMSDKRRSLQQDADQNLYQLKTTRNALNCYRNELHTPIEPLNKTIYQVNGILANFEKYQDIDYNPINIGECTQEWLAQCENALKEVARVVEKSGYQEKNPWQGCVLSQITQVFKQRFSIDATRLSKLIVEGRLIFSEINKLLGIEKDWSFNDVVVIERLYQLSKLSPQVPIDWLSVNLRRIIGCLDESIKAKLLRENSNELGSFWKTIEVEYKQYIDIFTKWNTIYKNIIYDYDEGILSIDNAMAIKELYSKEYRSWLRIFSIKYHKIQKNLRSYRRTIDSLSYHDSLVLLDDIVETHTLKAEADKLFETIKSKVEWTLEFQSLVRQLSLGVNYISSVCGCSHEFFGRFENNLMGLQNWRDNVKSDIDGFADKFDDNRKKTFYSMPLQSLYESLVACKDNLDSLEYLIDYHNVENKLVELGIDTYLAKARENSLKATEIIPIFKKCVFRSWFDEIVSRFTSVDKFRQGLQDEAIASFKRLDKLHLEISKYCLMSKLISNIPSANNENSKELSELRHEINKKKKHKPIRKLIALIPNLFSKLKPCVMMSPLSVSTYFGESNFEFDTVIFDEASQIRTEEAICAIFRGRQTIIAGDKMQLPPTDFFNSLIADSDESDEDEDGKTDGIGAYESLLDEANLLFKQTLLWHYRSRHEDLIAFSNTKYYDGRLITFPSSVEKTDDMGVEYVFVDGGTYDRGGNKGNRAEAVKVAELVFKHFDKYKNERTLGIIAFGKKQQIAIETAIMEKRKEDSTFESFFEEGREGAFFIKNLETVQGDERDTIILSVGYAPDTFGRFRMNFGPLSNDGGERRLNVAVTRARYNLKLVSSILPNNIDTNRTSGKGPKLLRLYIDFAMCGMNALLGENTTNDNVYFDSPFEEWVYEFLTGKGFDVKTQVGCSGYRIDMAVRHPKYKGRFAIGIECDGASYHSARTARERDRLRQTILEEMGWTLHRVWSTNWIRNNNVEKERLLTAIKQSIDNYREDDAIPI